VAGFSWVLPEGIPSCGFISLGLELESCLNLPHSQAWWLMLAVTWDLSWYGDWNTHHWLFLWCCFLQHDNWFQEQESLTEASEVTTEHVCHIPLVEIVTQVQEQINANS
jgi:hypothetical protein